MSSDITNINSEFDRLLRENNEVVIYDPDL